MKTSFLGIGLVLSLAACGGTTENSSGTGGSGAGGSNQGGNNQGGQATSTASTGQAGNGGANVGGANNVGGTSVGGANVGGSGGSACSDVPAPMGQLECGGGSSAVSSGSGPIACATSCIDQADNAYEVFCQGNECECHYYPSSGNTSQGTTVASSSGGPSSTGSGGEDPSLVCTCTVANDVCAGGQHCCPAPWQ